MFPKGAVGVEVTPTGYLTGAAGTGSTRTRHVKTRLPAPCLVVLVGPSASGKSTWAANNFQPTEVVSSDELRARVGIDGADQRASPAAFDLLDRIVTARLSRKLTIVIDSLGYDPDDRQRWVAMAHAKGLPAYAVTFPTPGEECIARNALRDRPLPIAVIRKQVAKFPEVTASLDDDGFDRVHSETPIRLVAPQLADEGLPQSSGPRANHTFGLVLSRFDWAKGNDLARDIESVAVRAEAAGFRDIWLMDHLRQIPQVGQPWEDLPEVYTTLSYLAGHTSRMRLGALVTAATHRHPSVLGKMIATLDVLSGGRANLGIGLGWDRKEHDGYGIDFPDVDRRYAILEDTLQMLPLLWGKGSPSFEGKEFTASELTCYPRPIQEKIPILIGGSGEKRTLRLVARYGDAANLFGKPPVIRHKVEVLREHCSDIERDPEEVEVGHLMTAMVAPDGDALRHHIGRLRARNQSTEQYAASNNAGLAEDLVDLFAAYHQAGAKHSIVALPNVHLETSLEAFGDVISAFRS